MSYVFVATTVPNDPLWSQSLSTKPRDDSHSEKWVDDVLVKMDSPSPENKVCVMTVVKAVRSALIDVQLTALAEAIVDVRRLRDAG